MADSPRRSGNRGRTGPGAGRPGRAERESASGPGETDLAGKRERPDTGPVGGQATGSARTPGADSARPEDVTSEALLVVLRGIGASMFLTEQHLIVARDGAERRPRTGFQAFTFDAIRDMRIELGSAPSGRIVVWTTDAQEALSMFFDARSLDRAHELLDVAGPLIARSRPGRSGTDPAAGSDSSRRPPRCSRDTTPT